MLPKETTLNQFKRNLLSWCQWEVAKAYFNDDLELAKEAASKLGPVGYKATWFALHQQEMNRPTIKTLKKQLESPTLAVVGRVNNVLTKEIQGVLPVSCTTFKIERGTVREEMDMIEFAILAVKTAAGVNIHLDGFTESPARTNASKDIRFYYDNASYVLPDALVVSDSIREPNQSHLSVGPNFKAISIVEACQRAYHQGCLENPISFDMSHIRPQGTTNEYGMVASGPYSFANLITSCYLAGFNGTLESFMVMLSTINQEIRRGGTYKNGAITTSMPIWSPLAESYLKLPKETTPWIKKAIVLSSDYSSYDLDHLICQHMNDGSLWVEKATLGHYSWLHSWSDNIKNRLLSNVCREILLENKWTCNLSHVNLGQITDPLQLTTAFVQAMEFLCQLHEARLSSNLGIYESPEIDRQVGLGVIGLANLLATLDIKYEDFVFALDLCLCTCEAEGGFDFRLTRLLNRSVPQIQLAANLIQAFHAAAEVAREYNMVRAFTVAPTASCSFRYKDTRGFTTAPEISPPISDVVERISETVVDEQLYFYPTDAELASEVGWETYVKLVNQWQRLMNSTGLAHTISMNQWVDHTPETLAKLLNSHIMTTYYRLTIEQDYLDKSDQFTTGQPRGGGISCNCAE